MLRQRLGRRRQLFLWRGRRRFVLTRFLTVASFLGLIFYFSYHLIQGERGGLAFLRRTDQLEQLKQEIDLLEAQEKQLALKVSLMDEQIDVDLLEQQVRHFLGYVYPGETVVRYGTH